MKFQKNKKGVVAVATIIMIVGFIASLLTVANAMGIMDVKKQVAALSGSGNFIDRPIMKYQKCEQCGSYKYSASTLLATSGEWLNKPSVTDSYDVEITAGTDTLMKQIQYSVCNSKVLSESNCRIYARGVSVRNGETIRIDNVKNEEYVWAQYQKRLTTFSNWKEDSGAKYQVGFQPYCLREYDVLSGSSNPINANDCSVPTSSSSWKDRLLYSDADKIQEKISNNVNERVLQPNEVRWYVSGYLTSKAESFTLTYKNKEAWCRTTGNSGEVYQINTVQLGSGTYKVASVDWSDYLGTVNCCPGQTRGDEVCNSNFKWEKVQGSECSAFKSCGSPNWVPYSEKEIIKYSCNAGFCEQETKNVECANDYDCKDSNKICDLNTFSCVNANVNLNGQEIETIPDSPAECESRGGTWISEKKENPNLLYSLTGGKLGKVDVTVNDYCKLPSKINWGKIILVTLAILFLFYFRRQIMGVFRIVINKIPGVHI